METQLREQYLSFNTAHLSEGELEHELRIRDAHVSDQSRSKRERTLRELLKSEKEMEKVDYKKVWENMSDEINECGQILNETRNALKGKKAKKVPDQLHKTKLLHIFFRMERLKPHAKAEDELISIDVIATECTNLLSMFFSIVSPIQEVRQVELSLINESGQPPITNPDLNEDEAQEDQDANASEEHELEEENYEPSDAEINTLGLIDEKDKAIFKLVGENERLKSTVSQLLERITALERTRDINKPAPLEAIKQSSSSVGSETGEKHVTGKPKNFDEWLKQKGGSFENLPKNFAPESVHENFDNVPEVRTNRDRLPIHKWAVRYDGMDNGRRINEFLKEVEFNARSEGFTKTELFASAHHLFTRKARSWFMEINGSNELGTWENLVKELKSEFLPVDMDYQYERLVNTRRQGPREKFQDYYLDVVRIFRGMSRQWDDHRKFEVLFRNTREDCRTAMLAANVDSISKMREFGKRFDAINWQIYANKYNLLVGISNEKI